MCARPKHTTRFLVVAPVQPPQPHMQMRIVATNHLQIAPEERIVRHVKADQRCEEIDVRLGDVLTKEVWIMFRLREMTFEPV